MTQPRFTIGDPVGSEEVRTVFRRITGKVLPPNRVRAVVDGMVSANPLRFEFEVNRLRGYAWNQDEIHEMEKGK